MSKPILGTTESGPLVIDVERLVETRLLAQGSSGSGKSHAVRKVLEETHGRIQHLVFDPEGEYVTLAKEFDYVIAGKGHRVPADLRSAALLIRKLLELRASAIIDFHDMAPAERPEFMRRCLDALLTAPRDLWHDVLVVIEEAHLFAPQTGRDAASTSAVVDLATRGRKRGFCLMAVTQRISDLSKSVVAQCGNRLIGRTTLDTDVERAAYEIGLSKREGAARLSRLERGTFYAVGPALGDIVQQVKVGDTRTKAPTRGQRGVSPEPATARAREVLAELADLPAEAETEAKTLAEVKAENVRLKRDLAAKPVPPAPLAAKVERVEVPILKTQQIARLEALTERWEKAGNGVALVGREVVAAIQVSARSYSQAIQAQAGKPQPVARQQVPSPITHLQKERNPAPRTSHQAPANGTLGKGERSVLIAIAQHADGVSREQLTVLTGYKRSTRDAYLQRLRVADYIVDAEPIVPTQAGVDALGSDYQPLPTGAALWDHWRGRLPEGERKIMEVLVAEHPKAADRDALGEVTGFKRSTRDAYLQRLRSRKLVTEPGRGTVRASDMLFDGGR